MATNYPTYPATTFEQAVDLTIFGGNQFHDVINGDAETEVETESGPIPTVRKSFLDNFVFISPIPWVANTQETVFNQLRFFENGLLSGWYYAPSATQSNPIEMGTTPELDENWKLYSLQAVQVPAEVFYWKLETPAVDQTVIQPPYVFDTAILFINGVCQSMSTDVFDGAFKIENSKIILAEGLKRNSSGNLPEVFMYLGKLTEGVNNYIPRDVLSSDAGAGLVGWNGVTVADALQGVMGKTLTRVTDYGFFANWPQGKMFSWNGYAYMGFQAGGLHGSADSDAYIVRTRDGINFSVCYNVAQHTTTEGAAWFSVGVTASNTLIGIVRFRAGAGDTAPIRHVIYRSTNGSSWVAGEEFTLTTASGATPTLYHGFCLLPNGNFLTGYHAIDGELGYVEINPNNTAEYTKTVMLTPDQNLNNGAVVHVELNFLRRSDSNKILITSRSQFAGYQPPSMWVLDNNTGVLSSRVATGIPFSVNPVTPVFAPGFQRVLFIVSNRYDSLTLTNEQSGIWAYEASTDDAFNMNWSGFKGKCIARLSGDLNSNAGVAGVQHACLHGDSILIGAGAEVDGNPDRSDVFVLKMDYRPSYTQSQTAFQTSGAQAAAPRSKTEFGLWDGAGRLSRIRMNGLNLVNDSGTIFQFGLTNLNSGPRGIAFYTGEVSTPAIYIRSSGTVGSPSAIDINRSVNFGGNDYHFAAGARIRFNSSTSGVGPSTIYFNSTTNRLELNSTASTAATTIFSRSTDILTLTRSAVGSSVDPAGLYFQASNDTGVSSITGGATAGINFNVSGLANALRVASNGNIIAATPVHTARFAVINLPTTGIAAGAVAYANNGRKTGEAAGSGTGIPVWYDGSNWRTYYDNTIAAA